MGPLPPTLHAHLRLLADVARSAGGAPLARDDPAWDELFAPPTPLCGVAPAALEDAVGGYFEQIGRRETRDGGEGGTACFSSLIDRINHPPFFSPTSRLPPRL